MLIAVYNSSGKSICDSEPAPHFFTIHHMFVWMHGISRCFTIHEYLSAKAILASFFSVIVKNLHTGPAYLIFGLMIFIYFLTFIWLLLYTCYIFHRMIHISCTYSHCKRACKLDAYSFMTVRT